MSEKLVNKELRHIKPFKGVSFKDERLAFVPGQGAPCALFSTIPYSKTIRGVRYVITDCKIDTYPYG